MVIYIGENFYQNKERISFYLLDRDMPGEIPVHSIEDMNTYLGSATFIGIKVNGEVSKIVPVSAITEIRREKY